MLHRSDTRVRRRKGLLRSNGSDLSFQWIVNDSADLCDASLRSRLQGKQVNEVKSMDVPWRKYDKENKKKKGKQNFFTNEYHENDIMEMSKQRSCFCHNECLCKWSQKHPNGCSFFRFFCFTVLSVMFCKETKGLKKWRAERRKLWISFIL